MDVCWKRLAEKMEVLDKYKVDDNKRRAYRGRGSPLEWRRCRSKKNRILKSGEDRWLGKIFPLFREYNLQRLQSLHEGSTEREEMKRQRRMKFMKDLTEKI